jgi:hypothetical protein
MFLVPFICVLSLPLSKGVPQPYIFIERHTKIKKKGRLIHDSGQSNPVPSFHIGEINVKSRTPQLEIFFLNDFKTFLCVELFKQVERPQVFRIFH